MWDGGGVGGWVEPGEREGAYWGRDKLSRNHRLLSRPSLSPTESAAATFMHRAARPLSRFCWNTAGLRLTNVPLSVRPMTAS